MTNVKTPLNPMFEINNLQQQIISEFELFSDWSEKYQHLIDQGNKLEPLKSYYKVDDNLVKGCQSQLWLIAEIKDNKVYYQADCDSPIPKGIVALLIRVLSSQTINDIKNADLFFVEKTQLINYLSPNRVQGLASLIAKMKELACI
jgi:cysteine desulfuration protein SufE